MFGVFVFFFFLLRSLLSFAKCIYFIASSTALRFFFLSLSLFFVNFATAIFTRVTERWRLNSAQTKKKNSLKLDKQRFKWNRKEKYITNSVMIKKKSFAIDFLLCFRFGYFFFLSSLLLFFVFFYSFYFFGEKTMENVFGKVWKVFFQTKSSK